MNLLQSDDTIDVVEPFFDRPSEPDAASAMISVGTRVQLSYQGNPILAQVEAIERLGTSFVGRTVEAADLNAFRPGDLVRFRLRDICGLA